MMFWLVAIPVAVVLAALAWWSSGRAKGAVPPGPGQPPGIDTDSGWLTHRHNVGRSNDAGGLGGL